MLPAQAFVEAARGRGFGLWTGVPCSYLQPFINYVMGDASLRYVPAANEGDAVAIAAGSQVGGMPAVAMMQNSGLGNAVNPLTSLAHTHRIPMLLIVTLRGEPGGPADEPQHALMGGITTRMLDLMEIRWAWFPDDEAAIPACLDAACNWMRDEGRPFCLVMRKGAVAPHPAPPAPPPRLSNAARGADNLPAVPVPSRRHALQAVLRSAGPRDVLLATTGYTGRELYALGDLARQLYLVGAMGCACSMGLGLALARPDVRVIVLDGDGALLMRLGALSAIGYMSPPNLVHVLLDNGMHESTGGQATVSRSVHFGTIALACGYARRHVLTGAEALADALCEPPADGPVFIRMLTSPGVPDDLPRPAVTPVAVTERLRQHLREMRAS